MTAITTVEATVEVQLKPEQRQALTQAENEVLRALEEYEIKIQSLAIAQIQLGRALLNMRQITQGLGVWEQWQRGDVARSMMRRLGLGESPSSIRRIMSHVELLGSLHYLPAGDRPLSDEEKHTVERISQNMSAKAWDIANGGNRDAQRETLEKALDGKVSGDDADAIRQRHTPRQQTLDVKPKNQHLPAIGTQVTVKIGHFAGVTGVVVKHESADLIYIQESPTAKPIPIMVGNLEERSHEAKAQSNLTYAKDALTDRAATADITERRMIKYWNLLMEVHELIGEALNGEGITPDYRERFELMFDKIEGG